MNVLRVFTVSVAFFGNFATFSKFPKTEKRIRKPASVSQKTQDLNVFRSPAVSVAFYSNLLHLPSFEKLKKNSHVSVSKKPKHERFEKSYFFQTHSISILLPSAFWKEMKFYFWKIRLFWRKNKLCRFWEILLFQSPCTGNLQHSAYLNTINFSNKESITVSKKTQFLKILRSLTNLAAFYNNVLHFSNFTQLKKKPKTHLCFKRNPELERSEQSYFSRTHSTSILLPLAFFKDFVFYFLKIHVFFSKKANFARFEKLYYFSRILRQNC